MTWREISPQQVLELRDPLLVDVRSPCEHTAERILGSVNLPLLSDDERAEVGLLYKESGDVVARRHALCLIAPKIPEIVDNVLAHRTHGQPVIVYCWRGGLRSESVAAVLSIAGFQCQRLTGGYKAWRHMVTSDLSSDRFPFQSVVLDGLTGTGKTEILRELKKLGRQVLDLEELANHRGSAFGGLGKGAQPTQKNFEEAIWRELRKFSPKEPVFLEAESRKIGKLSLPDCVLGRIRSGRSVLVEGSLEGRAARLVENYHPPETSPRETPHLEEARQILVRIKNYLSTGTFLTVSELLNQGKIADAVKCLLCEYYDPLYRRSMSKRRLFDLSVDGDDPRRAAGIIADSLAGVKPSRLDLVQESIRQT